LREFAENAGILKGPTETGRETEWNRMGSDSIFSMESDPIQKMESDPIRGVWIWVAMKKWGQTPLRNGV